MDIYENCFLFYLKLVRSLFYYPQRERSFPFWPVVGEEGFEPPTPWFVATCSNPLSYRPHPVSTGSVSRNTLKNGNLSSPQPFRLKRCEAGEKGFHNWGFEKYDLFIFHSYYFLKKKEVIRMRGGKLFIILAPSYFSAGPPLQYRHRSRV